MEIRRMKMFCPDLGWDISIDPGKCRCIVGANGSGKTLLLSMTHALTELAVTMKPYAMLELLREESLDSFDCRRVEWHGFFKRASVEFDDGSLASIENINSSNGEFVCEYRGSSLPLKDEPIPKDYESPITFLRSDRECYSGQVLGELLHKVGGSIPKDKVEKLCTGILDINAAPKYFSPMPKEEDFKGKNAWYSSLDKWLDSFSHGEREIMRLIMAMEGAKQNTGILFIDNMEMGYHIASQEVLANLLPRLIEKYEIQLIYTTHAPYLLLDKELCTGMDEFERS